MTDSERIDQLEIAINNLLKIEETNFKLINSLMGLVHKVVSKLK